MLLFWHAGKLLYESALGENVLLASQANSTHLGTSDSALQRSAMHLPTCSFITVARDWLSWIRGLHHQADLWGMVHTLQLSYIISIDCPFHILAGNESIPSSQFTHDNACEFFPSLHKDYRLSPQKERNEEVWCACVVKSCTAASTTSLLPTTNCPWKLIENG